MKTSLTTSFPQPPIPHPTLAYETVELVIRFPKSDAPEAEWLKEWIRMCNPAPRVAIEVMGHPRGYGS
jgi:hypothetical protein